MQTGTLGIDRIEILPMLGWKTCEYLGAYGELSLGCRVLFRKAASREIGTCPHLGESLILEIDRRPGGGG